VDLPVPVVDSWGATGEPAPITTSSDGMVVIGCHIPAMNIAAIGGAIAEAFDVQHIGFSSTFR